jgi:hypothetical protein
MNTDHDLDRQLEAFLRTGPSQLPDPSFDAVRDHIDHTRQHAVIGLWRFSDTMNKLLIIGLGAAAVVAVFIGIQLSGPAAPGGVGGAPSPTPIPSPTPTSISGTVQYEMDLAPTTTQVDAVADGASVTGTAVTSSARGTHTVRLECVAQQGQTWAIAGTIEETSLAGERAGHWSAVIVRNGTPQQIGIWLSDPKTDRVDCAGWLGSIGLADMGADNFTDVQSGTLVPPPVPAS